MANENFLKELRIWDKRSSMTLLEAAFLWCEIIPSTNSYFLSSDVDCQLKVLCEALVTPNKSATNPYLEGFFKQEYEKRPSPQAMEELRKKQEEMKRLADGMCETPGGSSRTPIAPTSFNPPNTPKPLSYEEEKKLYLNNLLPPKLQFPELPISMQKITLGSYYVGKEIFSKKIDWPTLFGFHKDYRGGITVKRKALEAYASLIDERPLFLFSEERSKSTHCVGSETIKLPEEITINDLVFWICGTKPKDMCESLEVLDERVIHVLSDSFNIQRKKIKAYHERLAQGDLDHIDTSPKSPVSDYAITLDGEKRLAEKRKTSEIIEKAKCYKKIAPHYLALIMGYEDSSIDDLKKLSKIYLQTTEGSESKKSKSPFILPVKKKANAIEFWLDLLYRWIGWGQAGTAIEEENRLKVTSDAMVNLVDFQGFIKGINSDLKVNIPLPTSLYPKEGEAQGPAKEPTRERDAAVEKGPGEGKVEREKPDYNTTIPGRKEILKNKVRKAAKEIINANSKKKIKIRKSDLAKHTDIIKIIKEWQKENEKTSIKIKELPQRTIRDWFVGIATDTNGHKRAKGKMPSWIKPNK